MLLQQNFENEIKTKKYKKNNKKAKNNFEIHNRTLQLTLQFSMVGILQSWYDDMVASLCVCVIKLSVLFSTIFILRQSNEE